MYIQKFLRDFMEFKQISEILWVLVRFHRILRDFKGFPGIEGNLMWFKAIQGISWDIRLSKEVKCNSRDF